MKKIILFVLLILPTTCWVLNILAQPAVSPSNSQPKLVKALCPKISELTKNDMYWGTIDTNWQSRTKSFDKNIIGFTGAQWQGVVVGQIICLYKGDANVPFPISLEQTLLQSVPVPSGGNWSGMIDSHKICASDNIEDCPFQVKAPEPIKDLYEQIKYIPQGQQRDPSPK